MSALHGDGCSLASLTDEREDKLVGQRAEGVQHQKDADGTPWDGRDGGLGVLSLCALKIRASKEGLSFVGDRHYRRERGRRGAAKKKKTG